MISRESKPGRLKARQREARPLPKKGKVKRYILTCAQSNTGLHDAAWESMNTLAQHYDAEIIAARFTYNKKRLWAKGAKRSRKNSADDAIELKSSKEGEGQDDEWWDIRLEPHFCDTSVEIAPGLVWCGELQILPTAVNPLSGLESYTGRASAIIPHVTFAVQSVASPKHQGCKFLYTTGTVTLRNYIQKKAGQKAEFHHGYGGLLVEVCHDGSWFVRQLNADSEGVIYDLDRRASGTRITTGHRPEALVWGDIHTRQLEPDMRELCWGANGILEALRPRRQMLHDVLDFRSQNHHDRKDPWKTFAKHVEAGLSVEGEVAEAAAFVREASRPWCETVIAAANHDEALIRWLKEADFREDPANARFFLDATIVSYEAIAAGDKNFYPIEWAFRRWGSLRKVKFLRRDEDYDVLGVKLDMHGDKGSGGAKGSLPTFAKTGMKTITGDSHVAGLRQGAMSVGVMGSLDQGYNVGLSAWSHTFASVAPNGKRQLITIWRGRWRA